jgi:uncharacterized Fe-S center protein
MASKVFFTDFRAKIDEGMPQKLKRLVRRAGIGEIDFDGKFVAIKMHFGEPGNLAFLRPNYAKAVADVVKELGGKPFLVDCNTLYPGRRKNALEHLYTAAENGFNWITCGCPVLIGDGLKGTDDIEVPVKNGELCKTAYIGRAVMDADIFISLTHFKGHEMTGFGGCIKNIGMGCGSRAGKMHQHNTGKPVVNFYKFEACPTLYYTQRYPMALNLFEEEKDPDAAAARFVRFCEENVGRTVDHNWIETEYADCTPRYIAQKILESLEN